MDLSSMELSINPGSASALAPTDLSVLLSVLKSKHIYGATLMRKVFGGSSVRLWSMQT
jgi:hypothetical protein